MKRRILIFAFLLMSGPALAAINPVHDRIVVAKPAKSENVAVLLGDRQEKAELPLECSGHYLRSRRTADLTGADDGVT